MRTPQNAGTRATCLHLDADDDSEMREQDPHSDALFSLRTRRDTCERLARKHFVWGAEREIRTAGGALALSVASGMRFAFDEEGHWSCAFESTMSGYLQWATWTWRLTFKSPCNELVSFDPWEFVAGQGAPTTTQMPWAPRPAGPSRLILSPWKEFFPILQANDSIQRVEVREGVSEGLRRDFARITSVSRNVRGLFMLQSF